MELVAMLHLQLSVRGQFQDGSEDISVHCQCLSLPFILHPYVAACTACTAPLNQLPCYGALEIVTLLLLLLLLTCRGTS